MSDYTTGNGIWNGWSWRFVGFAVLGIALLQVALFYTVPLSFVTSLPLAVFAVAYIVILRVRERRLANAIVGVIASFVVGVVLELTMEGTYVQMWSKPGGHGAVITNLLSPLVLGLAMAFIYLRVTEWSESKRADLEEKRKRKSVTEVRPPQRVHKKKKKKRR